MFQGSSLEDLWMLCFISLKDKILIELVRSVIYWVLWIERNTIIFRETSPSSLRSLGFRIINLGTFWCIARNASQYFDLL
jgi:hypothetical protein